MALVKRESQLYASALAKQSAKESDKKRNVKVLDEETYVQVRTPWTSCYAWPGLQMHLRLY